MQVLCLGKTTTRSKVAVVQVAMGGRLLLMPLNLSQGNAPQMLLITTALRVQASKSSGGSKIESSLPIRADVLLLKCGAVVAVMRGRSIVV